MSPGLGGPYASLHPTHSPRLILLAPLAPLALATAGCSDVEAPVAPGSEPAAAVVETELRADRGTIDDRWAAISQTEVPGFAGYWYDSGTGEIVVAATNAESESAAREWAGRSAAASDHPGAPIRFELVSYDFLQLRTWKAAARELLGTDVVYIDADEVRNRLVLGVTPGAVTSQVRARTRALDIPDAGVELVTKSPLEFDGSDVADGAESTVAARGTTHLYDYVRPTMGGIQVDAQSQLHCTLGFNATLDEPGDTTLYFTSASHCSTEEFDPDTGFWKQDNGGFRVGRASHDLVPQTGTFNFEGQTHYCTSRPCRFSDVSLVAYDDTIDAGDVDLGRIAATEGEESRTIAGRFDVTYVRDHSDIYVGLPVRMVGEETGRTSGEVTHMCVDSDERDDPGDPDVDLLCQMEADYERNDGDSGGPVYGLIYGGTVALIGTHVGLEDFEPIFSTLAGIEADLGVSLEVCIPTGCETPPHPMENSDVEIDGPTEVLEFAECVYTAEATDGIPPYSYRWFIDEDSVAVGGDEEELVIEDIGEDDFLLELRVKDSYSSTAWAEMLVDVSPSHPDCPPSQ